VCCKGACCANVIPIQNLITETNIYLTHNKSAEQLVINTDLIAESLGFVRKMMDMFGLNVGKSKPLGQHTDVKKFLDLLTNFRTEIRRIVLDRRYIQKNGDGTPSVEDRVQALEKKIFDIMKVCDKLRDNVLPQHGVHMEDLPDLTSITNIMDKHVILKQKQRKVEDKRKTLECSE